MTYNSKLFYAVRLSVILLLSSFLSACQETVIPEDMRPETKQQHSNSHVVQDLDAICHGLEKKMQEMSAKRTTFALEEINRDLRLCFPLMSLTEQKHLMKLSDKMYRNFLTVDRSPEQQRAFDQYAFNQSPFPTLQQSHLEQLHPRDQYLLRHKGQAYIQLNDQGAGKTTYTRNSQYLAKVFAPYLPEAEKVFMVELGYQNQSPVFDEKTLFINTQEIIRRALFWQTYVKDFPQSPFRKDAQYLLNAYTHFLFFGSPESPVSVNYEGAIDIQPTVFSEIEQLANSEHSRLSDQASKFLKFINLAPSQRAKLSSSATEDSATSSQLRNYLKLENFDFSQTKGRDCFKDAICYPIHSK